jgi:beta-glucosidase-like glycosyl hydrolase
MQSALLAMHVPELVTAGRPARDASDEPVRHVLGVKAKVGLFSNPHWAPSSSARTGGRAVDDSRGTATIARK